MLYTYCCLFYKIRCIWRTIFLRIIMTVSKVSWIKFPIITCCFRTNKTIFNLIINWFSITWFTCVTVLFISSTSFYSYTCFTCFITFIKNLFIFIICYNISFQICFIWVTIWWIIWKISIKRSTFCFSAIRWVWCKWIWKSFTFSTIIMTNFKSDITIMTIKIYIIF